MSGDGRYVAHVSAKDGQQSLWLRQVATTSNVEIVPPAEVRYVGVTFSPDGNHIYYATYARGDESRHPVPDCRCSAAARDSSSKTSIPRSASRPTASSSRSSAAIRTQSESAVIVANADGSESAQAGDAQGAAASFRCSARRMVARRQDHRWHRRERRATPRASSSLVDVATGAERVLPTPDWRQVSRVAWLPDGSWPARQRAGIGRPSRRARSSSCSYPSGEARRITNDLSSYSGLSVAPDGRLVRLHPQRAARDDLDACRSTDADQGSSHLDRRGRRRRHPRHGVDTRRPHRLSRPSRAATPTSGS